MRLTRRKDNGIWMLTLVDAQGRRRRVSTGERTRTGAERWAQDYLAGRKAPTTRGTAEPSSWTLADALQDHERRVWSKQADARRSAYMVIALCGEIGETPLHAVTYDWLVDWTVELDRRGNGPGTISRKMSFVTQALREAVRRGRLERMPETPKLQAARRRTRWVTPAEEARLLEATRDLWTETEAARMRALVVFLADTGARIGEALRLQPSDLVAEDQSVVLGGREDDGNTKTGKSRAVPCTQRAWAAAQHVLRLRWNVPTAVRRFTRLRDAAGLSDVSLHTLRHTCASRLVQAGMDLYRVKEWLGHSSIKMTERYAHLAPSSLRAGVALLERGTEVWHAPPHSETSHTDGTEWHTSEAQNRLSDCLAYENGRRDWTRTNDPHHVKDEGSGD